MKVWRLAAVMMLAVMAEFFTSFAADDGSSVVVLYNSKMPASKSLAEYYAQKRSVPAAQVIGLPMSEKEAISRDEYRSEVEEPFLKKLEDLKLMIFKEKKWTNASGVAHDSLLVDETKIRYAALCFGVPVKIEQDNRIDEPNPDKSPAIAIRNE